ncbi:MAG TPA: FadR/GntR family transcriptional regulator [Gemmatimonadaceae bacterium]|nr:FadR/GntR family transcriptional regulator [Gemmatimonadaceae bacterium]
MNDAIEPLAKQSLSDRLAIRIRELIRTRKLGAGDRLPAIMEMARQFGVGHPTIREALKKLETMGIVEIRHGSGVYVARSDEVLLLAAPDYAGAVSKPLLLDLVRTRLPLELVAVGDAARHATREQLAAMRHLLESAGRDVSDHEVMRTSNLAFHRQIAVASGNRVLAQLLTVLHDLFPREQKLVLGIGGSRKRDHEEHLAILDALERHDEALSVERMRTHMRGVEQAVLDWDPERHPVSPVAAR